MALIDADPHSEDRGSPMPQTHDQLAHDAVMAKQTMSSTYNTGAVTTTTRLIFKNNMLLGYDDQGRVSSVKGFIPSLANYYVEIDAIYGYDVFIDILGLPRP